MFIRSLTLGRPSGRLRATIRSGVAAAGALALIAGAATAAAQASDVTPAPAKAMAPPAVGVDYHVTAHTGNRTDAGTDGNVYLTLYGSSGVSPEVQLDDTSDNFERNRTDSFDFRFADLGTLTWACIRFDHSGSDWYLDWVDVNGEFFQFYRWFRTAETNCQPA